MSVLRVHGEAGELRLEVAAGQSVRDALDTTAWRVRAACGGTGGCGACVVRLVGGEASPPTVAEYLKLTPEERAAGQRLACQLRLLGDAEVALEHPAPPSAWTSIPPENLAPPSGALPQLAEHGYGLAVDLGTTHIRVALWDRRAGKRIASRRGPNPQGGFGADVLNRLQAAGAHPEHAAELAAAGREAILHALRDMLARDVGEVTPMLAEIGRLLIVGNTAMLALLTGHGGPALLDPAGWQEKIDVQPVDRSAWAAAWQLPHARIDLPGPVAGFVGSDLLADLLATGLIDGPPGSLLLDIGTNTELALWDGACLHVTSVPGGPAFEGSGLAHGMPAEAGAIWRVTRAEGGLHCATLGGGPARGFCGSGLTDAIAELLAGGQLKPSGRFAVSPGADGYRLVADNPATALSGSAVDAFQRAKAAIAAAMAQLLRLAGVDWGDLRRLCVCGAFGHRLDIANAQALGLLPALSGGRIELYADASLAGCERALLAADSGEECLGALTAKIKAVNLSLQPDYDESYIDHLRLRPIPIP